MNSIFEPHTFSLLIALGLIYLINSNVTTRLFKRNWINGINYGVAFLIILLINHFSHISAISYGNFLILSLSGLFGGFIVVAISTIVSILVLSFLPTNVFFVSFLLLVSSSLLGLLCFYLSNLNKFKAYKFVFLFLFGLSLQIVFIAHQTIVYKNNFFNEFPLRDGFYMLVYSCLTGVVCYSISKIGKQSVTEQLRIIEDKYKFLLDTVSGAVFKTDRLGRITYANNYLLNILNLSLGEIKGKNVVGIFFNNEDDDESSTLSFIDDIQDQAFHHQFDAKITLNGDKAFWFKWDCKIAENVENNQFFELLYTGIDITDQKNTEQKLKELSEKNEESALLFKSLLNAIPDAIGVQNVDKSMLLYNDAGYALLGVDPDDVYGRKCYEIIGKTAPCEVCASRLVLQSNKPELVEKFVPEMNAWLESRAYPVLDSKGNIKYIIEHLNDITTRKNNELALKKSELLYRNMVEKSPLGILFFDYIDNTLVYTNSNSAANQLLSILPEKNIGKSIVHVFPFFNKPELLQGIANTSLYGNDFKIEQLEVQGQNSTYFFEINAFQSEISKVVLLISDISYRIKDREELELSEQKFRTVITENPMVFFTFDKDGIFTLSEGQGLAKLGLKPGQVVGMSVFEFYKDFPEIINSAKLSLKGESIKSPIKVGDIFYDTVFTPYFDQNKLVKGVLGVAYDITARVIAENESARKSEELERYFNNSLDLLCIADLKGTFHKVNPEWGRLLGFKFEELIGANFFDFIHPDDIEATKNTVAELAIHGKSLNFTNRYRTKDSGYRWIEWRSFLDDQLIYAVARDITERKVVEERTLENDKLLQEQNEEYLALNEEMFESNQRIREINEKLIAATERAQESDRLKSAFLANMSHEIRTPMNGIVGFCQLLRQTNNVDDQVAKYCDIISTSSNQLLSIINDIIDISKIEAGQVTLSHEPVSINDVIEKTISLFQAMASQNNVKLLSPADSVPLNILSDNTKIAQILSNLINNAIKFTKGGIVEVGFLEDNKRIKIWVKDNGIGIAKENQKIIFDRFRQVDGANSNSMKGTGLGLSISKSLVELLGGEIWLESELGLGSVFTFTIPNIKSMEKVESESIMGSDSQKYDFNGAVVLLAEDDNINMMLLRKALENANVKVLSANNGLEAVELVKSNSSIKAILMDIKMPVMDGIEATQAIKSIYPKLPIIAQTAYALPDERKCAIQAGCDAYITKPINIALLYKTLKQLL